MFVRIARFEGGTAEGIDRRVEAIKANMAEGARDGMRETMAGARDGMRETMAGLGLGVHAGS
jgi:hypothetical protein